MPILTFVLCRFTPYEYGYRVELEFTQHEVHSTRRGARKNPLALGFQGIHFRTEDRMMDGSPVLVDA